MKLLDQVRGGEGDVPLSPPIAVQIRPLDASHPLHCVVGQPQKANSRCKTEITSNWVFASIEPSFFMSRFLSVVRI